MTAELASNFRAATEKAGLSLTVDCPPLDGPVYVDVDMWEKIVLNLLSNALKFTFEGGITVRLRAGGESVELVVQDSGTGIAADQLPNLFDRFRRIEGARGRSYEGSGIGLALVQEMVKLHGGRIAAESVPGAGSTFRIVLPLGRAHLPADAVVEQATAISGARATSYVREALSWLPHGAEPSSQASEDQAVEDRRARGQRVIVADDNADMRSYLSRLLREAGYEVSAFSDGLSALDAARRASPHLLLADVMMPGLDGFALARAVRSERELVDTPVVLLSARAGEELTIDGLNAGADDYLVKPFSARELLARVQAAIRLAETRRQIAEVRREETARVLRLFDDAPGFICVLSGPDHRYEFANASYRRFVGRNDLIGVPVAVAIPEVVEQGFVDLLDRVCASGEAYTGHAVPVALGRDGERATHYVDFICQPVRDGLGRVTGIFVQGADVTERTLANERQRVLANELNHRVKNTLATLQSIIVQTLRNAPDLATARVDIERRIVSLAAAHDLLIREHWSGAGLTETVQRALDPFRGELGAKVSWEGGDVRLSPKQALALSLALHELATNAAKYGALSNETGSVEIRWSLEPGDDVRLNWRERDGPPVRAPERTGFGTRLLARALAGELGGPVDLRFEQTGVECDIRIPAPT